MMLSRLFGGQNLALYESAFAPTGIRVFFRAPQPANPARIPVNASVDRY
jgi:hypothetical protein